MSIKQQKKLDKKLAKIKQKMNYGKAILIINK